MNRAVTIRCVVCGLEVVGVKLPNGEVRPHDRARPEPDAKPKPGYCIVHATWRSR